MTTARPTASLPDEFTVFGGLVHAPDRSGAKLAAIGPMPYTVVNTLFDAGFSVNALNYWKSNFLASLSDDAIDTAIARFDACPSPMSALVFEHFHGAATRVDQAATAFPHRGVGHNLLLAGEWMNPADSDANIAWHERPII